MILLNKIYEVQSNN